MISIFAAIAYIIQVPRAFRSNSYEILPLYCGEMQWPCRNCKAIHWPLEHGLKGNLESSVSFESCCKKGAVQLSSFRPGPPLLTSLFQSANPLAKHFRANIRAYNGAFTFTSMNYQPDSRLGSQAGSTGFQIHGELYHVHGSLTIKPPHAPRYAQLFFYDSSYVTDFRQARQPTLDPTLLKNLHEMLEDNNLFVPFYRTAQERLQELSQAGNLLLNPRMQLVMESSADRRRENLPVAQEVAVIIPDESDAASPRDIILATRDNQQITPHLQRIHSDHPAYMPLHYVLLFPHGDLGFHWALRLHNIDGSEQQKRLSQHAFYRYHLYLRGGQPSNLFLAGRLFQQYIVDAWACCDQNKLQWMRKHQAAFRSDLYNGLSDIIIRSDVDVSTLGRRIILPSSYVGGDRYMMQLFQDSMAIVRQFGRPTLFITFTANPR